MKAIIAALQNTNVMPAKKRKSKSDESKTPSGPTLDGVRPTAGAGDDDDVTESVPVRVAAAPTDKKRASSPSAEGTATTRLNRKALFIAAGAVGFLALVGVVTAAAFRQSQPAVDTGVVNTNSVDSALAGRRLLDGTPASPGTVTRWPLAIMIDNLSPARPQSGLGLGRVVYETLAEGGATRFMALYDGTENPERIGPVRSSRHYFVNLAEEYRAAYVHAGGSPQAAAALKTSDVTDFNLIGSGARYGFRVPERPSPHNLYTDDKLLTFALRDAKLLEKQATFSSWRFEAEPALEARPTTPLSISIKFSSSSFQADWQYERERNVFLRSTGGTAHVDALTDERITAKNVAVMRVPAETSLVEKGRIDVKITGEGAAQIFRDGQVIEGTWKKPSLDERLRFYDASGAEVVFRPGPTWIEVVPGDREVLVSAS